MNIPALTETLDDLENYAAEFIHPHDYGSYCKINEAINTIKEICDIPIEPHVPDEVFLEFMRKFWESVADNSQEPISKFQDRCIAYIKENYGVEMTLEQIKERALNAHNKVATQNEVTDHCIGENP